MTKRAQVKSGKEHKGRIAAMREKAVSTGQRRIRTAVLISGLGVLAACTQVSDLQSPSALTTSVAPDASARAAVDWAKAEDIRILAMEYAFSPNQPIFKAGMPYRLRIRNTGDLNHEFKGSLFLDAIAIRDIQTSVFIVHGNDGHVDKAIAPDKADGAVIIPAAKADARDLVGENNAAAAAEAEEGPEDEASDPFAAKPGDDEAEGEEAANPFAAPPEAEEAEAEESETEEASDPFAAEPEAEEAEADDSANPFAAKPEAEISEGETAESETAESETEEASDPFAAKPAPEDAIVKEQVTTDIKTEDTASEVDDRVSVKGSSPATEAEEDDTITAKSTSPVTEAEQDDKVGTSVKDAAVETTPATESPEPEPSVAEKPDAEKPDTWKPLDVDQIVIPVGHEAVVEFVALKPGTYRIHSGNLRYAISGMHGAATIE